jgi:hypothetical protein
VHHARLLVIGTATVLAVGLGAPPAGAAPNPLRSPSESTTQTFEVLVGTLDVDSPATADIGAGAAGGTITGQLGATTVTDSRASGDASWEASVTSTVFQTGGGSPPETALPSDIDYWSGPATATTGDGTFTPGQTTSADSAAMDVVVPLIAFTHTGGTGGNTATWNPTVQINVPLDSIGGVYTGTVTHSVA